MADGHLKKQASLNRPTLPSRTPSSANKSSQRAPITIEISSSEDERVRPFPSIKSMPKPFSPEKRPLSSLKQTSLDVSLWNIRPTTKTSQPSPTKDPTTHRSIPSSSTRPPSNPKDIARSTLSSTVTRPISLPKVSITPQSIPSSSAPRPTNNNKDPTTSRSTLPSSANLPASNAHHSTTPQSTHLPPATQPATSQSHRDSLGQGTSTQSVLHPSGTHRAHLPSSQRHSFAGISFSSQLKASSSSAHLRNAHPLKHNTLADCSSLHPSSDKNPALPSHPVPISKSNIQNPHAAEVPRSNLQKSHVSKVSKTNLQKSHPVDVSKNQLSKSQPQRGFQGDVLSTKEAQNIIPSRKNLESNREPSSLRKEIINIEDQQTHEHDVSFLSSRKAPKTQKDVINRLNHFSYRNGDRPTSLKDQGKLPGPSASNHSSNSASQPSRENLPALASDQRNGRQNSTAHTLLRNDSALLSKDKHPATESTNSTSRPTNTQKSGNGPSPHPGNAQKSTSQLVSVSVGPKPSPPRKASVPEKRKDVTPVVVISNRKAITSLNTASEDGIHVHKKRKCGSVMNSGRITNENRFTELPDSDQPDPTSISRPVLPDAVSSQAGKRPERPRVSSLSTANPRPATVAPCVMHPRATLPLPQLKPRIRPQSPDWSGVPVHRRPLQGQERPEEFCTDLQRTWILNNTPDLSTPLGHLIFSEEINANQMWENPDIPRIDVVVPDDVREKMFENSKSANDPRGSKAPKLDRSLAPPLEFIYTDRLVYRTAERPIPPNWHCNCHGDCLNNPNCECRAHQSAKVQQAARDQELSDEIRNFEGFAYVSTRKPRPAYAKKSENEDDDARSIQDCFTICSFPVFECNSLCGCGPDCINRTVGRGRREKLSIEKTMSRGWGVFANHPIPAGRLVTHYSGELITDHMSHERGKKKYEDIGRTYIFDLDPWWLKTISSESFDEDGLLVICEGHKRPAPANTSVTTAQAGPSTQIPNLSSMSNTALLAKRKSRQAISNPDLDSQVDCIYSVDAFLYGNIGRFINHSCNANTVIVPVYIEDSDATRPIFAMFAKKMIRTGQEITTSYSDPNADHEDDKGAWTEGQAEEDGRCMVCKCGAPNCRGIMFA